MKKMAKVMVLVLALCFVLPSMCFADGAVAAATIVQAGQTATVGYLKLTDTAGTNPQFANRWFKCTASVSNAQLATALTAMSLGKTVQVGMTPSNAQYSNITYIYLNP